MARRKKSFASQLISVVVFVILLVVMLNMCSGDKDEPVAPLPASTPASTPQPASTPASTPQPASTPTDTTSSASTQDELGGSIGETVEAWVAAKNFVERQLKAPSTAKFNGYASSPYVVHLGGSRYRITASVDSQNSFGAMLRTEFVAVVRAERDEHQTWILESLEF